MGYKTHTPTMPRTLVFESLSFMPNNPHAKNKFPSRHVSNSGPSGRRHPHGALWFDLPSLLRRHMGEHWTVPVQRWLPKRMSEINTMPWLAHSSVLALWPSGVSKSAIVWAGGPWKTHPDPRPALLRFLAWPTHGCPWRRSAGSPNLP